MFRIIFLECDLNVCKKRILDRRVNIHTGSQTNLAELSLQAVYPHMEHHPKDKEEYFTNEVKENHKNINIKASCKVITITVF